MLAKDNIIKLDEILERIWDQSVATIKEYYADGMNQWYYEQFDTLHNGQVANMFPMYMRADFEFTKEALKETLKGMADNNGIMDIIDFKEAFYLYASLVCRFGVIHYTRNYKTDSTSEAREKGLHKDIRVFFKEDFLLNNPEANIPLPDNGDQTLRQVYVNYRQFKREALDASYYKPYYWDSYQNKPIAPQNMIEVFKGIILDTVRRPYNNSDYLRHFITVQDCHTDCHKDCHGDCRCDSGCNNSCRGGCYRDGKANGGKGCESPDSKHDCWSCHNAPDSGCYKDSTRKDGHNTCYP